MSALEKYAAALAAASAYIAILETTRGPVNRASLHEVLEAQREWRKAKDAFEEDRKPRDPSREAEA